MTSLRMNFLSIFIAIKNTRDNDLAPMVVLGNVLSRSRVIWVLVMAVEMLGPVLIQC